MLVDYTQKTSNSVFSANTTPKGSNISADEFQASLNDIKKQDEKENKKSKTREFTNTDLDMSKINSDFKTYAWNKLRTSQYKKNEETLLNNLFSTIDAGNKDTLKI